IKNEEVKLFLFAVNRILYMENPKDYTGKLLKIMSEFSRFARKNINLQKSVMFLYTNNELYGKIRYIGINLSTEAKDVYNENDKTLIKEIKEDTNKWKDIPCSWIERNKIVKISILPK
ncbi:LORF2 protein, partial [Crocuta crocuta]